MHPGHWEGRSGRRRVAIHFVAAAAVREKEPVVGWVGSSGHMMLPGVPELLLEELAVGSDMEAPAEVEG